VLNNNRHILSGGKSIFSRTLIEANMDKISDWVSLNGVFYSYQAIIARGAKITIMLYNQILAAIPKEWKRTLQQPYQHSMELEEVPLLGAMPKNQLKAMLIKRKLIKKPSGVMKWETYLGESPTETFWNRAFQAARKVTKEPKLQIMQYKIIHHIIPTKQYLFLRKTAESPNCMDCKQIETVQHMLYDCEKTKELWLALTKLFNQKENSKIECNITSCIIGSTTKSEKRRKFNFIATHLKYHIYMAKFNDGHPSLNRFFLQFKRQLQIHSLNQQSEVQLQEFEETWKQWLKIE